MSSFGESLRRERELRGITLPELANATKISLRHLRALEDNQFDLLPSGVFRRGFVRAVARYMKLDENHWVSEFAHAANEPAEVLARYAPPRPRPSGSPQRAKWSFALLLALFAVGAYVVHEVRLYRAAEASPPVAPPQQKADVPPPTEATLELSPSLAPGASSQRTTKAPTSVKAAPAPPPASTTPVTLASAPETLSPATASGELNLQIDVLDDAWIKVIVDEEPNYEGLMKAGDTRTFRGTRQIELVTGNASAVVLTLNSETLAPLGNPGELKKVILTAKDLRPSTP